MPKIANEEELKTVGAFQKSELQRNKTFYLDKGQTMVYYSVLKRLFTLSEDKV